LEDGSILSAPYDADETQLISLPADTDSILTRVSHNEAKSTNPNQPVLPTMQSPQIPSVYIDNVQYQRESKAVSNKLWLAGAGILVCVAAVSLVAFMIWSNAVKTPANNNVIIGNQNGDQTNSNRIIINGDKKNETGFGPLDYQASLNGENLTYYRGTTPEQCQADCAKNEKCKGFTFIRAGAYNPNDSAMCYLASLVTGSAVHTCCISGVKR
jgi:hypothetical protein